MNVTKLAAISEIISSVAILVTLIFLTVEMQQNTKVLQANGRQETLTHDLQYLDQVINNPNLILSRDKSELTVEEAIQMEFHLLSFLRMREFDWLQYKEGAIDEITWANYSRIIPQIIDSTQRTREIWQRTASGFDQSFVAEVNELITHSKK